MQNAVPSSGPQGTSVQQSPSVQQLRKLMEDVSTIKAEREVIESELKSATADMKSQFLRALADDGAISEAALSTETLGRMYGPLQKQVQESLQRQEILVASIQVFTSLLKKGMFLGMFIGFKLNFLSSVGTCTICSRDCWSAFTKRKRFKRVSRCL